MRERPGTRKSFLNSGMEPHPDSIHNAEHELRKCMSRKSAQRFCDNDMHKNNKLKRVA
ncbi:hypothetical protein MES5069_70144 [Mesorhizobium escarrei]|uniref:Uncharacterized protein n=1 Tax=Mesorhizobium escarrei TaxID=666018 RepID=A0ABM9EGN6_9HYPH|nr:hypothetical protein MES5069_70144 [Mesorhizobium escarrei]